jgi:hypothetical protein
MYFMKRVICICALVIGQYSCGGGKHEPVELKDSAAINASSDTMQPGTGYGTIDSTNGAMVRPIDTANSARRN